MRRAGEIPPPDPPHRSAGSKPHAAVSRAVPAQPFLIALVLGPLLIAYVIFRNGGWVYDDNLILVLARSEGFSLGWLNRPIFQHWDVGMNGVYSVMVHLFPLDYRWGLLALLLVLGAAIFVFERVLSLIAVPRWATLALTAWFGLSILWIRPLQWWADGVQAMPTLLCDLVCLYAMLRFCADGRGRWIATSSIALAVGLLFYEKPALMPVYLALVRALLMSERLSPARLALTFWRERRLWLTYCAIVAIWAFGYFASGAYSSSSAGHVSAASYLHYFRILWVQALVPALAGFTLPTDHLNLLQTAGAIAVQVGLLSLFVVSILRKRSAWRAWVFIALVVVLDGGLVAHSRVAQFGVGIGADLRYLMDFTWLIPLALCCAFSGDWLLRPVVSPRPRRVPLPRFRGCAAIAVPSLLVLYGVGSVATAAHLQTTWGSVQSRHWESNVERSFASLRGERARLVVADQAVPFQIISYPFAPLNRLSHLLPLYVGDVQVDGPLDGQLVSIDSAGVAHRAAVGQALDDGRALGLWRAHRLTATGAFSTPRSGQFCLATAASPAAVERRVSARAPLPPGPYYLLVRYTSARSFASPLYQDPGTGYPRASAAQVMLSTSSHASLSWLDSGLPRRLKLLLPARTRLCLRQVAIVTLRDLAG
ncbi:MAG: hypothetical protein M3065_22740 [Actinomycetota bacterium]|nr:hypothetical protein [Actinomycetota bacterium]